MFSSRRLSLFAFSIALVSCSPKSVGPPPGFAVVRFENLTGDASLDWLGRAASEVLSTSLAGAMEGPVIATASVSRLEVSRGPRPVNAPGISAQRSSLLLSGARRMISGYFVRTPAGVRFEATDEDVTSGKTVRILSFAGPASVETLLGLSRQFSGTSRPYLTNSTDSLRLFVTALGAPPTEAVPVLYDAIRADPNFGPARTTLARVVMAQGPREEALQVIEKSLKEKLDPLSLATLRLDRAALQGDEAGRVAALTEIIDLNPGDTSLLRQLAEVRTASGMFAEAAGIWQKLSRILPDDADVWNQMGYARAWAGDYAGSLLAMKEYARIRPKESNPADSTGDVHFMFRKYAEAAASYMASAARDPGFQLGASLYKAAWSHFLAGDKASADKVFNQLRTVREKAGVTNFGVFEGDWLYRTGRVREAVALVRKEAQAVGAPEAQAVLYEQLVVWDLLAGDRETAVKDAAAIGQPKTALAAISRFIAQPSASAAEWEARANAMLPGPGLAAVRRMALGYALLLDGKRAEAIPIWEQIAASAAPGDFAMREVETRLKGQKPRLAVLPNPVGVNQFAALIDKL